MDTFQNSSWNDPLWSIALQAPNTETLTITVTVYDSGFLVSYNTKLSILYPHFINLTSFANCVVCSENWVVLSGEDVILNSSLSGSGFKCPNHSQDSSSSSETEFLEMILYITLAALVCIGIVMIVAIAFFCSIDSKRSETMNN